MIFRDIVTNIAIGQRDESRLKNYIKRLAAESVSRRLAAIVVVVLMVFQVVAFIAPPKPSNASSNNDIIPGGFSRRADLLATFDANPEIRAIYGYFGVARADIVNAAYEPNGLSGGAGVWSIGRQPHSSQDRLLNIPGASSTIYIRPLSSWGTSATYSVLHGTTAAGREFWILYGCGNLAVRSPDQPPPPPPPPPPQSFDCQSLTGQPFSGNIPLDVAFTAKAALQNTTVSSYLYDFGDGTKKETTAASLTYTYKKAGKYTASVQVKTPLGTSAVKPPCQVGIIATSPNLRYLKTAENTSITAGGKPSNANGATAQPGNTLRYHLVAQNTGDGVYKDFVFEENVTDILEYADITDAGGAVLVDKTAAGGKVVQKIMTWPAVDIKAASLVEKTFTIKIKDPLPTKPAGVSDPQSFDLCMDNVFYQNAVKVCLPPPPVKRIEQVTTSLPKTGAGAVNLILALFAGGATFLYLRARLLKRELVILENMK